MPKALLASRKLNHLTTEVGFCWYGKILLSCAFLEYVCGFSKPAHDALPTFKSLPNSEYVLSQASKPGAQKTLAIVH